MNTYYTNLKFILLFAICFISNMAFAQYQTHTDFGDFNECNWLESGPFRIWWDKDVPFPEASNILSKMNEYRADCINNLGMQDPPNVQAGAYANVFAIGSEPNGYFQQFPWGGCGVGTENEGTPYRGPYLGCGRGVLADIPVTRAHETFHLMQYSQNSPGWDYTNHSAWYTEACANLYGTMKYPTDDYPFINGIVLRKLPHVPFWLGFGNIHYSGYEHNWNRGIQQYTRHVFLYYMITEKNVPARIFTEGYYIGTDLLPQEYMASQIGIDNFRNHFFDFATMMHDGFHFLTPQQYSTSQDIWNTHTYIDRNDENEFTLELNNTGTNGWYSPSATEVTTGWSFNAYKLTNSQNRQYTFQLSGNAKGDHGDVSHFKAKVIVKNSNGTSSYHDIPLSHDRAGELTLSLSASDTEAILLVASLPDRMDDDHGDEQFQTYPYQINIIPFGANNPVTNAGIITAGETFCGSIPAQTLTGTTASGNCGGNIQYQWEYRVKSACTNTWTNWLNWDGQTGQSANWVGSNQDHEFRRRAKKSDCSNWAYSNSITYDVDNPVTDAGTLSGSGSYCGSIPGQTLTGTAASGGCGSNIKYQWEYRVKSPCTNTWGNWTTWSGQTGQSANWTGSNEDNQFRRRAKRRNCHNWSYSNTITILINNPLNNAGTLSGGGNYCGSIPAQTLSGTAADEGCGDNIQYQWEVRYKSACTNTWTNWQNWDGQTGQSANWVGSNQDHEFRRIAKRGNCITWVASNTIIFDVDNPLTNVGTISGGGTYCGSIPAQTLTSTAASGGCGGDLQYQWEYRVKSACTNTWDNWTTWSGQTAESVNWTGSNQDNQFRRKAKRSNCSNWAYSNTITFDIDNPLTDVGSISGGGTYCGSIPAQALTGTAASDGCGGDVQYQWEYRVKSPCSIDWGNWTTWDGVTGESVNWTGSSDDNQFRRAAKRSNCGNWVYSNTITLEVDCRISPQLYVYLEGTYNPGAVEMTTTLNSSRGLLPGQIPSSPLATPTPAGQPYSIAPWSYTGTEGADWTDTDYTGNETDWILVSFRTDIQKNTEVAMAAALLMKDGSINFTDRCVLPSDVAGPLYIVVEHRNHIGIMTPQPVDVIDGTLTYDFRSSDSYHDAASFGQKQLPTGEWVMYAGDASQMDFPSFDINGTDKTIWFNNNGVFDYYLSPDFNLDGDVNGQDKSLWFDNNGISSRVPK